MAFTADTATLLLESGVQRPHPINDIEYVVNSVGTLPLAGLVLTIDANGELIPYDGVTASGVGVRLLNDEIDGDGTTTELMRIGKTSVDVLAGQTPVFGDTVGVDATGAVIVGGTFGTFLTQEVTDVWTISVGY